MKLRTLVATLACLSLLLIAAAAAPAPAAAATGTPPCVLDGSCVGLPDADPNSGKFVTTERGLASLSDGIPAGISLQISSSRAGTGWDLAIFDPGVGGLWDRYLDAGNDQTIYKLYADPLLQRDASGVPVWTSDDAGVVLPDNDWFYTHFPADSSARASNGNYYYYLQVEWKTGNFSDEADVFKVAVQGLPFAMPGGGLGFQGFRYILRAPDIRFTSYDGEWNWQVAVPTPATVLNFFDGDADRIDDTDDPNSPNCTPSTSPACNWPPFPTSPLQLPEGVNPGNPKDDSTFPPSVVPPPVYYTVDAPGGAWSVTNSNPSGNMEWELFCIGTNPSAACLTTGSFVSTPDAVVSTIPAGTYSWRWHGADGQNNIFVHADYNMYPNVLGSIGNEVWFDSNNNGYLDQNMYGQPTEPAIAGVKVNLWRDANHNGILDAGDVYLGSKTTDANGYYKFTDLPVPEDYIVEIDPVNFQPGQPLNGLVPTANNSTVQADHNNRLNPWHVKLPTNMYYAWADFGFSSGLASGAGIGNQVWWDKNGNGVFEPGNGEVGIDGVTIDLYTLGGTFLGTATTANGGLYQFTGLPADTYKVIVTDTAGKLAGMTHTDGDQLQTVDNTSKNIPYIVILGATDVQTVDFGYKGSYKIGNLVWVDCDGDGVYDGTAVADLDCTCVEAGVSGVTLDLIMNGKVIATTTTAANGTYYFTGLMNGVYTVDVTDIYKKLDGYVHTLGNQSQAVDNTSKADPYTLTLDGADVLTADFGYTRQTGKLGNQVWIDSNGDGRFEYGEAGVEGVTISLYRDTANNGSYSTLVGTTTTSSTGQYWFSNLAAGKYKVLVTDVTGPLAGMVHTLGNQSQTVDNTSKENPYLVSLWQGQILQTADFGYKNKVTYKIGNLVWVDCDGDGVYDGQSVADLDCTCVETGIAGVTLDLLKNGNVIATTTTAANGTYYFTGLANGDYTVNVTDKNHKLDGYVHTLGNQSQAVDNTSKADPYNLTVNGADVLTADFGYTRQTGKLGNQVWIDSNGDGRFEYGEAGVEGVTISLYRDTANNGSYSTLVGTTTTSSTGQYWFSNLAAGKYKVLVTDVTGPLAGMVHTLGNQSQTVDNTSKENPYLVSLWQGQILQTADFGYKNKVTYKIGNLVWVDCDGDGVYDGQSVADLDCTCVETGIAGVTLDLLKNGNVIATTTTAANGTYYFTGLANGDYTVNVTDKNHKLDGYVHTLGNQSQAVDNTSKADPYNLTVNGADVLTVDFGYTQQTGKIGNQVWNDSDGNARFEYGEAGIAGVTLSLYRDTANNGSYSTLVGTTTTSSNGQYWFSNLAAGKYKVLVTDTADKLAGMVHTLGDQSLTADNTSKANPYFVTLAGGQTVQTADFGYKNNVTYKIGNLVWVDCDGDGVYDGTAVADLDCTCVETGIAGVTLDLLKNGNVIATTTTAANGTYYFAGLANGVYSVNVTDKNHKLDGYVHTLGNQSQAVDNNSKADPFTVTVNGADVLTVDFGYKTGGTSSKFTTYTQGGWGAPPSGSNPGMLLRNNFAAVYPAGVTIGGYKTIKFTSPAAIQAFLPAGGTAGTLSMNALNPTSTAAGVFAGQVLALQLNVDFSNKGILPAALQTLHVKSGDLAGQTVSEVLTLANKVLGGNTGALPAGVSLSELNDVVTKINENFDNGTVNNGYLIP